MKWPEFLLIQLQLLIVGGLALYSLGRASIFESDQTRFETQQKAFNKGVMDAVQAIALEHVRNPGR